MVPPPGFQGRNVNGQDEPQAELAVAKFITIAIFSIGARFGICTVAKAEKFIWAMAARSALAEAEADALAAAEAWAEADN